MKRTIILSLLLVLVCLVKAQSPVTWQYTATKTGPGQFEVHLKAIIQEGWHVYAQDQPEDAIAVPTAIKFTGNPVLTLKGKPKEQGEKQHFKDSELGISAWQYANKVEFVQKVTLKVRGKTNLNGSITFQACTDEKCLPPATIDFSVHLEE